MADIYIAECRLSSVSLIGISWSGVGLNGISLCGVSLGSGVFGGVGLNGFILSGVGLSGVRKSVIFSGDNGLRGVGEFSCKALEEAGTGLFR